MPHRPANPPSPAAVRVFVCPDERAADELTALTLRLQGLRRRLVDEGRATPEDARDLAAVEALVAALRDRIVADPDGAPPV